MKAQDVSFWQRDITLSNRVNEKKLALLCSEFSIVLSAGINLQQAVHLVSEHTRDRQLKQILIQADSDMKTGLSLSESFAKSEKKLPVTLVETIKVGEETGRPDMVFNRLYSYYDQNTKVSAKVKSAVSYPIMVLITAILVVIVIMLTVMPTFIKLFENMGIELPVITRVLVSAYKFFKSYGYFILAAAVILTVVIFEWVSRDNGRYQLDKLRLKIPILGQIEAMYGASQLANTLSIILETEIQLTKGVEIAAQSVTNSCLRRELSESLFDLESGIGLGESLSGKSHLPSELIEMIRVGEETSSLQKTLLQVGKHYDDELEIRITSVLNLLEPILIISVSLIVVFILFAIYLPMLSIYKGI